MSLTTLHLQKCREDGHIRTPSDSTECPSCGRDDQWSFYCDRHNKMYTSPVCDACERAAEQEEVASRAYEEEQERRRQAAKEEERRRREYEEERQRKRDEAMTREKAFIRIAKIPTYIALVTTLLCMGFTAQFFTHGEFVFPYTAPILLASLGTGITAALSIFVIAIFFEF